MQKKLILLIISFTLVSILLSINLLFLDYQVFSNFLILALVWLYLFAYQDSKNRNLTLTFKGKDITRMVWVSFGALFLLTINESLITHILNNSIMVLITSIIILTVRNITKYDKLILIPFILIDPFLTILFYTLITIGLGLYTYYQNNKRNPLMSIKEKFISKEEHPFLTYFAIIYFFFIGFTLLLITPFFLY